MPVDEGVLNVAQKTARVYPIVETPTIREGRPWKKILLISLGCIIAAGVVTVAVALPLVLLSNRSTQPISINNTTTATNLDSSTTVVPQSTVITTRSSTITIMASSTVVNLQSTVTTTRSSTAGIKYNSTIPTSIYASALTDSSKAFARTSSPTKYYFEAIEVNVSISGNYTFISDSSADTYGYLYMNDFNPFKKCNKLAEDNDGVTGTKQFKIGYPLQAGVRYILVVTTFHSSIFGPFSIVVTGSSAASLLYINNIQTTINLTSVIGINETIYGIYNTTKGSNSLAATIGTGVGNYPAAERPDNVCDGNTSTKYVSFGACSDSQYQDICGLNTGFYLTLRRGSALVIGFQMCAANDFSTRDPIVVTLEGSNQSDTSLTLGTSWTLIYSGHSGLNVDPGRYNCGPIQYFCNSVRYTSYRFLVTSKRSEVNSVQYSEVQLFEE